MGNWLQLCDEAINELSKFCDGMLYLGPAVHDDRLAMWEKEIGFVLPVDFKYILTNHNGISLNGTEVYGIDAQLKTQSLDKIYYFEHFDAGNPMPPALVPFSPDGFGNHYCLNLLKLKDGICPVVFWQHDYEYENVDEIEECNGSFADWIREVMIEWTIEEYNYDGSIKSV